jgi:hypothetical protein
MSSLSFLICMGREKFTELKDLIKILEYIKYDNTVMFDDELLVKEKKDVNNQIYFIYQNTICYC